MPPLLPTTPVLSSTWVPRHETSSRQSPQRWEPRHETGSRQSPQRLGTPARRWLPYSPVLGTSKSGAVTFSAASAPAPERSISLTLYCFEAS